MQSTLLNYQRAINYATILKLVGFKAATFRQVKGKVKEYYKSAVELPTEKQEIAKILSCATADVVSAYSETKDIFENVELEYTVLFEEDSTFPQMLKQTKSPPPFLFIEGGFDLLKAPAVSVVGSRNASSEGIKRATKISLLLSSVGIVVVSGLARGIDTAAHKGAIKCGGHTIAVLGTPLNHCYPAENKYLQRLIASR